MLSELGMFMLAETVLAELPAIARPRYHTGSARPMACNSNAVAKTVVSDKFRVLAVAGMEGSGHHYFIGASNDLFNANPDLPRISTALNHEPFYLPVAMGKSASNYAKAELQARQNMQKLAEDAAGLPFPSVFFAPGGLSYPFDVGPQKAIQYHDLKRMAEEAESAGVDMRVVYLKRPARDMIIANTVHRLFQRDLGYSARASSEALFLEYVRIFFTDTAVLQSILGELDPAFIVCHDWDSLGDERQASEIAGFVSPNNEVADMVAASIVDTAVEHGHAGHEVDIDALTFDGAEHLVSRLQEKLDSFEALYCAPKLAV